MNTHVYPRTSISPVSRGQNDVVIMSRFATLHRRQDNVKIDVNRLRIIAATSKWRYFDAVGYDWAYRIIFFSLCRKGKWTRLCTHAPQFHQHHDVKMASLLYQDSPCYTDVKRRSIWRQPASYLCSNFEMMLFRCCRLSLGLQNNLLFAPETMNLSWLFMFHEIYQFK